MSSSTMLPVIDSKYKVLRTLGKGGGGTVFVAWHEQLQREVAIKVLTEANPETTEVQRFKKEAQALTACNHAGIVHILAFGKTDDNRLYYVMDYIDGKSLAAEIKENGPLQPGRFEHIFEQVLSALDHAHQAGLIHRDIKPSNIMLTTHGGTTDEQAILIDFGLTRSLERNVKLTATDSLVGTPFYMSPEQCTGGQVDQRSDIYSLGCTMLEAATGEPPFSGEAFEVLFAQVNQAPDTVPKELMPLMDGCLAKEVDKRFPNARATLTALDSLGLARYKQFSTGKFALQSGQQAADKKKSTPNRRMQLAIAAATATVLAFFYLRSLHQQQQPKELPATESRAADATRPSDEKDIEDARHFSLDLEPARFEDWKKIKSPNARHAIYCTVGHRHFQLGHYATAAARYKAAVETSSEIISLTPEMFGATVELYVRACMAAGIPMENWLKECNFAIRRAHERSALRAERALLALRAEAYAQRNQRADAERDFREATAIADNTADLLGDSPQEAYLKYAEWSAAWKEEDKARAMFRKGVDRIVRREAFGMQASQSDIETLVRIAFNQPGIGEVITPLTKLLLDASHTNNPMESLERQIWASQLTARAGQVTKACAMLQQIYDGQTDNIMRAHVLHSYMDAVPIGNQELLEKMLKALQLCKEVETPENQLCIVTSLDHVGTAYARNKKYREAIEYAQQSSALALREARSKNRFKASYWMWYDISLSDNVNAATWAKMIGDETKAKEIVAQVRKLMKELESDPEYAAHRTRIEQLRAALPAV